MKVMQKYFLALVPPAEILDKAHKIKIALRDQFGIKYALKSPPHITLKMPFSYNEAKEDVLVANLQEHLKGQEAFRVKIDGVGTFGNRVIYLAIEDSEILRSCQRGLTKFCKERLHLTQELSDRNYHPHLTVAFKDLKANHFSDALAFVKQESFTTVYYAAELTLLKRIDGVWILHRSLRFSSDELPSS
ncbi:2'-5' RNA ligase family protein [Algoriphagus terrigena]|uniref:2'-5' RNA ligase family protein n=1 Tax=Algoriphagus terrigena TaxID=344884 RepID=UPI0004180602|nr:2'-5' RNA ligase family protein [Algoriphagus terrigena]